MIFAKSGKKTERFQSAPKIARIAALIYGIGMGDSRDQSGRQRRADARDLIEPFARLIRSMPGCDAAVELQDLRFQRSQLSTKSRNIGAGAFGEPGVICIGDDFEQLLDATAPDRCDDPELGQVSSDGIDDGRLLTNEQMSSAMEGLAALLFRGLGRHEAHVSPG
jgi:hypothetical protein